MRDDNAAVGFSWAVEQVWKCAVEFVTRREDRAEQAPPLQTS
jgi:hypothetical protein